MIRLKISLKPKKNTPINLNYKYYLAAICNDILIKYCNNIHISKKKYSRDTMYVDQELLTFSQFFCPQYELRGNKIIFKDVVSWYISSSVYEIILQIVQKFFNEGSIKVSNEEFEILALEASETAERTVMELNNELVCLTSDGEGDIYEKMAMYYSLSEDEKII